jgi:hypothetical protein
MSKKTKNAKPLPTINVGDRVRHPNGTEGQVTGTDGFKATIAWSNGETVTWEGSYLRIRGIKVIGDEPAVATPATPEPAAVEQVEPTPAEPTPLVEQVAAEQTPTEPTPVEPLATETTPDEKPLEEQPDEIGFDQFGNEVMQAAVEPVATMRPAVAEPTTSEAATPAAKPKRQRKAPAEPKEKKLSALDAAAKVLGEAGQPMTCPEMIDAMAAKQYWTSPGGQTPAATLYSAILREVNTKGTESRFVKTERGRFGRKA